VDILEYFEQHAIPEGTNRISTRYIGRQIYRAGITDMGMLCAIMRDSPERIKDLRNIGEKSFELILEICKDYENIWG
jgi:hypothetical protein